MRTLKVLSNTNEGASLHPNPSGQVMCLAQPQTWYNIGRKAGGMDKVGNTNVARSRGEMSFIFLAPVIEGVRCELANGLKERAKKI